MSYWLYLTIRLPGENNGWPAPFPLQGLAFFKVPLVRNSIIIGRAKKVKEFLLLAENLTQRKICLDKIEISCRLKNLDRD
jgi:hypothetical protein